MPALRQFSRAIRFRMDPTARFLAGSFLDNSPICVMNLRWILLVWASSNEAANAYTRHSPQRKKHPLSPFTYPPPLTYRPKFRPLFALCGKSSFHSKILSFLRKISNKYAASLSFLHENPFMWRRDVVFSYCVPFPCVSPGTLTLRCRRDFSMTLPSGTS